MCIYTQTHNMYELDAMIDNQHTATWRRRHIERTSAYTAQHNTQCSCFTHLYQVQQVFGFFFLSSSRLFMQALTHTYSCILIRLALVTILACIFFHHVTCKCVRASMYRIAFKLKHIAQICWSILSIFYCLSVSFFLFYSYLFIYLRFVSCLGALYVRMCKADVYVCVWVYTPFAPPNVYYNQVKRYDFIQLTFRLGCERVTLLRVKNPTKLTITELRRSSESAHQFENKLESIIKCEVSLRSKRKKKRMTFYIQCFISDLINCVWFFFAFSS